MPFFRGDDDELRLVLVRQAAYGAQGGQIAFPGGKIEPFDADHASAALRELEEEIGVAATDVELVAELPAAMTRTSGFRVYPFVGRLRRPPEPIAGSGGEIAAVMTPRVSDLVDPHLRVRETFSFPAWPEPREVECLQLETHLVWGLTLRILDVVLPRALAREWEL